MRESVQPLNRISLNLFVVATNTMPHSRVCSRLGKHEGKQSPIIACLTVNLVVFLNLERPSARLSREIEIACRQTKTPKWHRETEALVLHEHGVLSLFNFLIPHTPTRYCS